MVTQKEIVKQVNEGVPLRVVLGHKGRYKGRKRIKKNRHKVNEEEREKFRKAKNNYDEFMKRVS